MLIIKSVTYCIIMIWVISYTSFAQSDISEVSVSKADLNTSLDMLQKQGSFSAEDIKKAKEALAKMDEKTLSGITSKAHDLIKNNPDIAKKMAKSIGE